MGKTQFSFILARKMPVFYFNFTDAEFSQNIYSYFEPLKDLVTDCLESDRRTLKAFKKPNLDTIGSRNIFNHKNTKLLSIGLIWNFIMYSLKHEGDFSLGGWFNHYLSNRTIAIESLSLNEYYNLIGKNDNLLKNSTF